ncbi:MAG: hypothetical protein ABRQ39_20580 [Candidatus Eremiobacterota bacterium]
MKFTSREIALTGVLAGLNGALEITLGNYLHALHFFFTGNVMVGMNICIYMCARKSIDRKGIILIIGFITAFIKLLLGYNINAALFIFLEALIIEGIIFIMGFNLTGNIIASISVNLLIVLYKFGLLWVMGGSKAFTALIEFTRKFANYMHINNELIMLPFILLLVIYSLWGIAFGLAGWRLINSKIFFNGSALNKTPPAIL